MTRNHDVAIIEQNALALPSRTKVKLKMCNLRLHSSGVFSNVYRGTLIEPEPRRLLALSREKHKNIVQVIFTFQTISDRKDKRKRICHRDIKPQNILIDPEFGLLKIGDFGSAKHMTNVVRSTPYQVTRFYRPPELLLDSDQYSCLVDVWSAGCCMGEMLRGEVLFPGRDGKHQLKLIMQALGTPTENEITAMKSPTKLEGEKVIPKGLESLLPKAPPEFVIFLKRILVYTPKSRLCGRELLLDPFFNDIFMVGKKRLNGRLISDVISMKDKTELQRKRSGKSRGPSQQQSVMASACLT
uniref:Protein kinase domain-containing protein n=1 Tax=Panagrolaimus superbus TaxID=310955 RepID=A0A914Z3I7_9BILA